MSAQTIYSIYTITNNINGKVYVGFTEDIRRRWKSHINDSKRVEKVRCRKFHI